MPAQHEIRCTNPNCPSRQHADRGALACRVEVHPQHVTIAWKCRRCKRGQRTPLPTSSERAELRDAARRRQSQGTPPAPTPHTAPPSHPP